MPSLSQGSPAFHYVTTSSQTGCLRFPKAILPQARAPVRDMAIETSGHPRSVGPNGTEPPSCHPHPATLLCSLLRCSLSWVRIPSPAHSPKPETCVSFLAPLLFFPTPTSDGVPATPAHTSQAWPEVISHPNYCNGLQAGFPHPLSVHPQSTHLTQDVRSSLFSSLLFIHFPNRPITIGLISFLRARHCSKQDSNIES